MNKDNNDDKPLERINPDKKKNPKEDALLKAPDEVIAKAIRQALLKDKSNK